LKKVGSSFPLPLLSEEFFSTEYLPKEQKGGGGKLQGQYDEERKAF